MLRMSAATTTGCSRITDPDDGSIKAALGTVTVSRPFAISQTFNDILVSFIGYDHNVTNTASATTSRIARWRIGGTAAIEFAQTGEVQVTPNAIGDIAAGVSVVGGTILTSQPMFKGSQTWNDAAATFFGMDLAVTNTNSAAASRVFRVLSGATPVFGVTVGGALDFLNGDMTLTPTANTLTFSGGLFIVPDGTAASISVGVEANTGLYANAAANSVGLSSNGTGVFLVNPATGLEIANGWPILFVDNTTDIGASGATRPRNIYLAEPMGTVGSGTGLTVNAAGYVRRVVYKATCSHLCFAAAALTADKTFYTLAAKQQLTRAYADVTVAFTGGGVTDADMTCGTTAGGNEILATFDVDSAAITRGLADADMGTAMTRAAAIQGGYLPSWTATTAVQCRLTTVTANTDQLTAGTIVWYLETLAL